MLASMQAVEIVWWQSLWLLDFLLHLVTDTKTIGPPLGMSNYMFEAKFLFFSRVLSLYHGWLPFVLLWLVWRLGYDRPRSARPDALCLGGSSALLRAHDGHERTGGECEPHLRPLAK